MTVGSGKLVQAMSLGRALLFAGAGVSRSVGLPSWTELMAHLQSELGLETISPKTSYQALAEFYRLRQGSIGPLRSWMDKSWSVSPEKVRASRIHELIVQFEFPIIYTTNYDNNLELAHEIHGRKYLKVASTHDLSLVQNDIPQIIKFHGDFADDQSLVIAETDYFRRLAFESPLDIKFRSDALGKTLLFVGYSLSDLNIRLMLYRLWQTWRESGRERDRPGVFVFTSEPDPIQEAVLENWGITTLCYPGDPEESLTAFLEELSVEISKLRAQIT